MYTVAERISVERGESVGDTVGYKVCQILEFSIMHFWTEIVLIIHLFENDTQKMLSFFFLKKNVFLRNFARKFIV